MKIADKVNNYLQEKYTKDKETRNPTQNHEFFPSGAMMCNRKEYYNRKIGRPEDPELSRIFLVGQIFHDWMEQNVLSGGEAEKHFKIQLDDMEIRGRADYVDEKYVYELKTIKFLKQVLENPLSHHVSQINLYLGAFNMRFGKLVYIEKNTFQVIEHVVEFSQELYDETVANYKLLKTGLDADTLPSRKQEYPGHWECKYCNWKDECDGNKNVREIKEGTIEGDNRTERTHGGDEQPNAGTPSNGLY